MPVSGYDCGGDKMSRFDWLCADFSANKPNEANMTERRPLFTASGWSSNKSINDILVCFLTDSGHEYINDFGVVWFRYGGQWCKTEHWYDGDNVKFDLIREPRRVCNASDRCY